MAAILERSFIEISGFERETASRVRDITINLGVSAAPGAVKHPDSAGGFFYEESGKLLSITSNRFIHWSTSGDTVQLVEQSLDVNLLNNAIRLKIPHCPLLPGGVHVHETLNNVVILIVTCQSVHQLVLPHPTHMYRSELVTELQVQSIFTDVWKVSVQDAAHSYVLPPAQSPITSATWLSPDGHAHFALATPSGGITVVTLPPHDQQGSISLLEMKHSSVMQRLAGWMPTAIRGEQSPCDLAVCVAAWPLEHDTFLFTLCQDHKLRVWSYREQQCVLAADLLEYVPAGRAEVRRSPGQTHRMRLSFSASTGLCVAVYLAAPNQGQFCVLQLVATDNSRYSLEHISTLFNAQETLVDFVLTSTDIWGLWVDDDNQTVMKYINFEHNVAGLWNQVFVQPPPDEEIHIGPDQDPREAYLDALFSLRFTAAAVVKALQIYRRGSERILDLTWDSLKKEVTLTVENELQSSVTEFEVSQEDYRMLQLDFWSQFYACCLQYQEALSTPLALHVNQATAMVCLLKKGFVSFLLPCFAVDHLYLSSDEYLLSEEETPLSEDPELGSDVLQLVQCVRLLGECVQGEMACEMDKALDMLQSPERAAEQVLENLLANDSDDVIEDITNKLQDVRNPLAAMNALLRELDLETDMDMSPEGTAPLTGQSLSVRMSLSQLYGSTVAVSVVCQTVCLTAMSRAQLCRDLLILQHLYLRLGDNMLLPGCGQSLHMQQDLIPRCCHLLCCYHLLKQLSQTFTSPVPLDTLDTNLQHLSVLKLTDSAALAPNRSVLNPQTVVELFYQNVARKVIVSQLFGQQGAEAGQTPLHWPQLISSVVHLLAQHLWPSNPSFLFPECMMGNCQYTQLQEYVRLIGPWCQANVGSCRFILGQAYLASGEGHKALQCFQEAAAEVEKEEFLMRVTGMGEEPNTAAPRLLYYNKVLQLLEDVGLPELVINLATLAISEAGNDQRRQAALWTRIFKHHLDLGHNREAYEALTQNPEPRSRLDCLRQLVVVLCERAQLQDLVQFPYVNLHEEVVVIIESRARAVDLLTHNYYELLYAFHINRHNYRKAGTVMFEYSMRLGREVRTLRGLQKQVNCLLAALNCLRLIRPEYAWIVQPSSRAVQSDRPGASPKRDHDGELAAAPVSRQIEILELKDVEKEYVLARSRLTLAQHQPASAALAGGASAVEMVALLVQSGLFDTALLLCHTFKLPLTPVFEGLTFKCIKLQYGGEQSQNEAWTWLAANQLAGLITTKECSATDEAWRLLAVYLEKHPSQNAQHHRCVINRLLSHGVPVPDWLVIAFKEVDAATLLRLYLNYDLLEPAAELVLEYVDALLGKGHQYFGVERPLSAVAPLVWLPYTSIDQLLQSLGSSQPHSTVYERLKMKLKEYYRVVEQSSRHRVQAPRLHTQPV
ncbi:LOW QUALITY PROTEIN: nuclear pore complex protein Nup160 [Brachyhypopomus gauderio]|uniref:LOW QUALITY PROTEIN: nuclear pore complex protein Nup160 n=1 Tax=Brachyhypopomus gauderio TaxID=698409 RepID=UPI004040FDA2